MTRRRSAPWIHRWSRPLMGVIATVGAVLTAYLTAVKLTGGAAACPSGAASGASGCDSVLSSPYATVFGLPLALFGCLAYASMAAFALGPLAVNRDTNKALRRRLEAGSWLLLLAGSTAMTAFSGYLMYVLATQIQALCPYCIGSAVFSLSLFGLTIVGRDWEDVGQLLFVSIVAAMVTLLGALGIYADVGSDSVAASGQRQPVPTPTSSPQPGKGWPIDTESGPAEMALARHLSELGATMYGAYWCPHCDRQKNLFGQEAFALINYVECDPEGPNAQPSQCKAANIKSYPTWQIEGETYRGTIPLAQLAEISGYQGPTEFKYKLPGR